MADMLTKLVLALCLIAIAEVSDSPLWNDDNENHHILSPAGADSSFKIIEVKPLSPGVTAHSDQLLYYIPIEGRPLTMSLEKQNFLSSHFQVFVNDKVGTWLSNFVKSMGDCYYSGQIIESSGSSVTLRTCFGLRGIIEFLNESFFIEPLQKTPGLLHKIYKMEASEDVPIFISENDTNLNDHSYQRKLLKPLKRINKYNILGASPQAVLSSLLQTFSYINTKFVPLQMEVFLSTIDLWTESNLCVTEGSVSDTLDNFIGWLSGLPSNRRRFDIPLLILDGQHPEVGKTYFGQMCSENNGAVVTFAKGLSVEKFSGHISHILGHNVGMLHHHSGECPCPAFPCIMDVSMTLASNSKTFSNCSLKEFRNFIIKTGATCLLTHLNTKSLLDTSLCGNRILDNMESCDCGTEVECRKDPCCDYKTCTLKPGAICAHGACCSKCQFLPSGTLCRAKKDECDLPEYCSGTIADCPEDDFQQNGNQCNDKKSVCYNGICQNVDSQCVLFFGPASRNADLECYQKLNVIGDRFGNCGGVKGFYGSCQPQDVLCGKLHCILDGEEHFSPDMAISYYTFKHHVCVSGDFSTDHFIDPLWVKDGTKCGENKICINKKCTNHSRSDAACKQETTCYGHGVCNNKHQCHCNAGWNPPFCSRTGDFGIIDSKSITDDSGEDNGQCSSMEAISLRIWLLIFFLFILPLLMVILWKTNIFQKFTNTAAERNSDSSEEEMKSLNTSAEVDK
ncbi:disintegrin and metalloproteinase domain-containing protein 9-like isoform X2 [Hyla sarda]|uniref:disintegrin and metalloproteinase domain-containing protein 9-like isoform X2 n=1 Tax=Hyla sarda TaxID=327740 RepID=UPI0024C394D8|nr:disintegrin and metalloproteinase domain-containing protein 9-like isoform X2 [Hyla sarda]